MVPRELRPYVGVTALGALFVTGSGVGLFGLAGDPGLGPGLARVVLVGFLLLGALAVVVAGVDAYRHSDG